MRIGEVTVLPAKPIVSDLKIAWKPVNHNLRQRPLETFKSIKGLRKAMKIVSRRNTDSIRSATWNGMDILLLLPPQHYFRA